MGKIVTSAATILVLDPLVIGQSAHMLPVLELF